MFRKESLKQINNMTQWIVSIATLGMWIYCFFISKNIFKETQWLILWGGVFIINVGSIINSKYFEDNFNWKNIRKNIIYICISTIITVRGIIKIILMN